MSLKFSELYLEPVERKYPLDSISAKIASIPYTKLIVEEKYPFIKTYIVGGDKDTLEYCLNYKKEKKEQSPTSTLITVNEKTGSIGIGLYSASNDTRTAMAIDFIKWMLNNYKSEVVDDEGQNWTDRIRNGGPDILFE